MARPRRRPGHRRPTARPAAAGGRPVTGATLLAVADHRPHRVVSNDEIAQSLDTSDEWIRSRTGIATRGIAGDGESVIEMAAAAAGKAVAASGVPLDQVDLVLLASCS